MKKADFANEVYSIVKEVPYGCVVTYGQIAHLLGKPNCSRMVGQAMSHTPSELNLPCHRVVNSQGRLAPGWEKQYELLEKEGVTFRKNGNVDLMKHQWKEIDYWSPTHL